MRIDSSYIRTVTSRLLTFSLIGGGVGAVGGLFMWLVLYMWNAPKKAGPYVIMVFVCVGIFTVVYQSWPVITQGGFRRHSKGD